MVRGLVGSMLALTAVAEAVAANQITIPVSAQIAEQCVFGGKLNFPLSLWVISNTASGFDIDPDGPDATGNHLVQYRCTRGTTPVFSLIPADGNILLAGAGGATLAASISIDPASIQPGTGLQNTEANSKVLTLQGLIRRTSFRDAEAGYYEGVVQLTVMP